jgi:hypothetical protein
MEANAIQLTIQRTAGVRKELHKKFIAARNGKPAWLTKSFVRTVRKIEHHDVVGAGIFAYQLRNKDSHVWTKHALITLQESTEAYIVQVAAKCHS